MPPIGKMFVTTTQLFSRRALEQLLSNSGKLPEGEEGRLRALKSVRKRGVGLTGEQEITYKLSRSGAGQLGYGRLYATKTSLEQFQRECRGTLCAEFYYDIDMENAQPVLLSQFAHQRGVDLPQLDTYIESREVFLRDKTIGATRDEAKAAIIAVIYGANPTADILKPLSQEIRNFTKTLTHDAAYLPLWRLCESEKSGSKYGAFLNWVLSTEERKCMLAMKASLESLGWTVDVLAYDGVMVRRREGVTLDDDTLFTVAAHVERDTGYRIRLREKKMEGYTLPPAAEKEVAPGVSQAAYSLMKADFEEHNFYFTPTDRFINVHPDTGAMIEMDLAHATRAYFSRFHFKTSDPMKPIQFFPLWCSDPSRREIDKIDMKPSSDPRTYSIPLRLAYQRAERPTDEEAADIVTFFQDYLNKLLPDDTMRGLFIEWIAHILQRPFENSKTCFILAGGKGCGKDTIGDLFSQYILGNHLCQNYDKNEQLWDRNDTGRRGKLFAKLEEASGVLNKKHEDDFKAMITSDTVTFRPLYSKEMTVPNYTRIMLTTNDFNPAALDAEERRFAVAHCSSQLQGNMEYWYMLRRKLFNPVAARVLGDWLMAQPVGEFPRVLPKSQLALDIIEATTPAEDLFLQSEEWDGSPTMATALYNQFRNWCSDNGHIGCRSMKGFSIALLPHLSNGAIVKRKVEKGVTYQRRGYVAPPE